MYHEHPIRILRYSAKNIWLLIFPLLRGVSTLRFDKDRFYSWVKGAWFDILILGLIMLFGLVRWYSSRIDISAAAITHNDGVIFRLRTTIPYSSVSLITVERPFYLVPFRAVMLRCDTSAGLFNSPDMKLMVSEKVIRELKRSIPDVREKGSSDDIPRPTALSILLFSVFFSSGFSGVVYIATFFFKGGDIAHDMITASLSRITMETEKLTGKLLLRIPEAAIMIGSLFIAAWLLSFTINVLRYYGFALTLDENCMKVSYGTLTRKEYRIMSEQINYTDLRQNLIMKIFSAVAVHISCAGYGYGKRSLPVLLPVRKEKNMGRELEAIGILHGIKNEFKPKRTGFWQYIWLPVILSAASFPVHFIAADIVPALSDLTLFAAIMLEVPSIWFIAVKFAAFLTSGISLYDDKIMIRCSRWTTFHTVIADRSRLVKLTLRQTIFQKMIGKKCSVILYFEGEEHKSYRVKGIDIKKAMEISELLDHHMESVPI